MRSGSYSDHSSRFDLSPLSALLQQWACGRYCGLSLGSGLEGRPQSCDLNRGKFDQGVAAPPAPREAPVMGTDEDEDSGASVVPSGPGGVVPLVEVLTQQSRGGCWPCGEAGGAVGGPWWQD